MNPSALPSPSNKASERGFILIIVLWISVGLVSIALLFGQSMMLEYRIADNSLAGMQSEEAIDGAVRYVKYFLTNSDTPGEVPEVSTYQYQWVDIGDSIYWFLGRDYSNPTSTQPAFGLIDECSKLNLNTATVDMIKLLPGMTDELAAAIIDWRDEDDEATENGAESDAYSMGSIGAAGYECKNATFETVDELHLVYGADWSILHGEDANGNGFLDDNENNGKLTYPADNQDGRLEPGILNYLTIYSREPNKNSDGSTRINITGSSPDSLAQLLQDKFGEDRATEIQSNLGSDLSNVTSILQFYILSKMSEEEFAKIDGEICISDDSYFEGLININTAPEAVLACIPGIGSDNASSVAAYRKSNAKNLTSVAWLAKALDEEDAIQAGPYVTAHSYQYMADVAAVGHDGKGYKRVQFIIDTSGDEPIVRYRKDATNEGWALGNAVRSSLATFKESGKL